MPMITVSGLTAVTACFGFFVLGVGYKCALDWLCQKAHKDDEGEKENV